MKFTVEALCISDKKGVRKHAVEEVRVIENYGIETDAHAANWHRQVSLLAGEAVDTMKARGLELEPGAFGENIVTRGIDWSKAKIGGRIQIDDVELEITQIGKECHTPCAIYHTTGYCIMPEKGIFAKIIKGGMIHAQSRGDYRLR